MPVLVDSHCHLDFPQLADRDAVVARARAAGVVRMINIGTTKREFASVQTTAASLPDVFCSFGIHPSHAHEEGEQVSTEEIIAFTKQPKVVGIGETGLDFYYDKAPREIQIESFRRHIRAAQQTGLPLIIHSREAEEDTIRILKEEGPVPGVLHCFSSKRVLAEQGLEIGLYVSLSGILTFKKSQELRDITRDVPMDRLLVETDSPYLAPEPYRGKPCEPAYVARTAEILADVKGVSFDEIAARTTANFFRLFTHVTALP
ncbi:MAG: TatD family hydrolase [Alphaproteobacteria bacterium]|nr:TatD family hydrolase [Alphaproteobacteria bacterium]